MAGATFSRIKDWVAEVLTYADLNAEIDNILENLGPAGVGGYSTNVAQMQQTTDPYPGLSPSLANSLAGEIERLRYQIQQIIGTETDFWYQDPPVSLSQINATALEGGLPNSRLEDGPVSGDEMIRALRPQNGVNGTLILDLTLDKLTYYIEGQKYEQLTSVNTSGFSGAPTTNQTALVNNAAFVSQQSTQYAGEHGTFIPVDTVGSEITSIAGKTSAFKVVNGPNTEYFIGQYYIDPTLGAGIFKARRGMFFDYQQAPWPRISLADNNVITLCRLAWIFIGTNGVVTASYNTPTYSETQPTSPDLGDYWFSLTDTVWRTYSPSGWALSGSVLIGEIVLDGNNVVGARTQDRFRTYSNTNEILIEVNPTNTVELRQATYSERISVYGNPFRYGFKNPNWTAANLSPAGSLANNTTYYAYIDDSGNNLLSTVAPHDRRGDLSGYYHPSFACRCVGYVATNGSAQFLPSTVVSFSRTRETNFYLNGLPETQGTAGGVLNTNGTGQISIASGFPTIQRFTSGSGTYTTAAGVKYIRVTMIGGGGGGGGSGTGFWGTGGTGGNTTFGSSLLAANGGSGGQYFSTANAGGAGGSASLGTGPIGIALPGGYGLPSSAVNQQYPVSGAGASSPFSGGGCSVVNGSGGPGNANTGTGGGGGSAGNATAQYGGHGGGAGGYVDALISSPLATYSYAVGAAGASGAAGINGGAGGAGGSGVIIVEEYY